MPVRDLLELLRRQGEALGPNSWNGTRLAKRASERFREIAVIKSRTNRFIWPAAVEGTKSRFVRFKTKDDLLKQVRTALGDGKALQFGLAPLQHADILQQPFQTVAVKRLNNFGLDEANGSGSREGVLQPANRPLPRLLLKANAEFHKPISNALGLGEFMSEFVLHP